MPPPLWPQILLQVILIVVHAYFAAAETALLSLNEAEVRRRAEEGDQTAAQVLPLAEKPAPLRANLQTGIALAGFLSAAFAAVHFSGPVADFFVLRFGLELSAAGAVRTAAVAAVAVIMALLNLLFGSLIPRRLAAKDPYRSARALCPAARVLSAVFTPLSVLLSAACGGLLRLAHIDPNQEERRVSEEDRKSVV